MPELPEVETIRRQLEHDLKTSKFLSVETSHPKSFRPSFKAVEEHILGQKIEKIDRQAKLIIFRLSNNACLLFHLKLTGRIFVRKAGDRPDDYLRSLFLLKSGAGKKLELRFCDARKFGFVKLVETQKEMEELLKGFGPEPFKDLTLAKFKQLLKKAGQAVKAVLMDQKKISGIGNIYANDALWLARIHPRTPAKLLGSAETKKLYRAILRVLRDGLKYGGASDQWYRQAHGEQGEYQKHFLVYGRTGQKCLLCKTIIKRIVVAGRGTFFCPNCQRETK